MSVSTLENQIKTEWSAVRAFVALHPYVSVLAALAAGLAVGRLL